MTVGYSMRQGTFELYEHVVELEHVLNELISFSNHKLILILIPPCIRKFIPLKYWPRKYAPQGGFMLVQNTRITVTKRQK